MAERLNKCISVPAVIEELGRLPTQRSELIVLEYLLRRRVARGTSLEKLYAGLLCTTMREHQALPDLASIIGTSADGRDDRLFRQARPR